MEDHISTGTLFENSISPLFKLAQYCGIFLPSTDPNGGVAFKLKVMQGLLCILTNIIGNAVIMYNIFFSDERLFQIDRDFNSVTSVWNSILDFTNYTLHSMAGQLLLVLLTRKDRWSAFALNLDKCLGIAQESHDYATKLRKKVFFATGYVLLQIICLIWASLETHLTQQTRDQRWVFASCFTSITHIYPAVTLYFFALVVDISKNALESIRSQVTECEGSKLSTKDLKKKHVALCETIDMLNTTFGPFLVLSMTSSFLSTITSLFYFFGQDERPVSTADIAFTVVTMINLAIPPVSADRIRKQIDKLTMDLIRLRLSSQECADYESIHTLIIQIKRTTPTISSAGFFEINLNLFPKISASSLTYFFILYQFKLSEKYPTNTNYP